jgi:hypothetical protein
MFELSINPQEEDAKGRKEGDTKEHKGERKGAQRGGHKGAHKGGRKGAQRGERKGTQRGTQRGTKRNAKGHKEGDAKGNKGARKGKQRKARVGNTIIDPRLSVLSIYTELFIPSIIVIAHVWFMLLTTFPV